MAEIVNDWEPLFSQKVPSYMFVPQISLKFLKILGKETMAEFRQKVVDLKNSEQLILTL